MSNKIMLAAAMIATAVFSTNAMAQGAGSPGAPQGTTSPTVGTSTTPPAGSVGAGNSGISGIPNGPRKSSQREQSERRRCPKKIIRKIMPGAANAVGAMRYKDRMVFSRSQGEDRNE